MKWTREQIIRQILRRETAGRPLSTGGEDGVEHTLYQAGSRIFGSWRNAVKAAGIHPDRALAHDRWPPSRILAMIRTLARRRRAIRKAELKHRYDCLVAAARRTFGSWPKAIIAAGVDPAKLLHAVPWTRERIIETVLTRALKNEPLASGRVHPKSLVEAANRIFGNWSQALSAAGLDPQRYIGKWNGDRLGSENLPDSDSGQTTGSASNTETTNTGSVGLNRRRWTPEEVVQGILARLREQKPMNAVAVRSHDSSLYQAARRRFGCWRNAIAAAGLNPVQFRVHGGGTSGRQANA